MPPSHLDQSRYQVRLDWGVDGLRRLAHADVVVVVDVLGFSATVIDALERGADPRPDAGDEPAGIGAGIAAAAADGGAVVLIGSLRNASAVAAEILALQERRGARTSVSIIATGEPGAPPAPEALPPTSSAVRFAVEDQLGAGAIIDALGARGIDHTSPDAAVASEAFRALRRAVTHLVTASGSGLGLIQAGRRDDVLAAAAVDAASVVPVLRGGVFSAA